MSDIVERLRDMGGRLRHEAADEIVSLREQVAALIEERHKSAEQYVNRLNQIDALTKELDTVRRLNLALTKNAMNRPKDCPSCNTWADNVSLREQVAALTKERDDRLSPYLYRELKADLLASQAREAAMRSCITDLSGWSDPVLQDVCNEALALPTDDTSLKERLKEERERCAKVCEELCGPVKSVVLEAAYEECATAIRSMT